jgi:D-methionine transport system ATP-binding protein
MIDIRDVVKTYRVKNAEVQALRGVSLHIDAGDIFGVVGYSGSGKTTLLRCINQLEKIDGGTITVNGRDITALSERELRHERQKIGMIFQHFNLLKNDTVFQNVALPLNYAGENRKTVKEKVNRLLELVGLTEKINAYPSQLSGGQKQRVAIARALANEPRLLLCDEATSALDPDTTRSILTLLRDLKKQLGLTIVIITHEMTVIKEISNKVAVLHNGQIIEEGPTLELFSNPRQPLTRQFAESLFGREKIKDIINRDAIQDTLSSGGIVARLLFMGTSANEAVISEISRRFNLDVSVIYGNIELFQTEVLGNLYVAIRGNRLRLEESIHYALSRGVIFEQIAGEEVFLGKEAV